MAKNPFRNLKSGFQPVIGKRKLETEVDKVRQDVDKLYASCARNATSQLYKDIRYSDEYKDAPALILTFEDSYYSKRDSFNYIDGDIYYKYEVPVLKGKDYYYPRNKPTTEDLMVLRSADVVDAVIRFGLNKHTGEYSDVGKVISYILDDGTEYELHGEKLPYRFDTYYESDVPYYKDAISEAYFNRFEKGENGEFILRVEWETGEDLPSEWLDELGGCLASDNWDSDPF